MAAVENPTYKFPGCKHKDFFLLDQNKTPQNITWSQAVWDNWVICDTSSLTLPPPHLTPIPPSTLPATQQSSHNTRQQSGTFHTHVTENRAGQYGGEGGGPPPLSRVVPPIKHFCSPPWLKNFWRFAGDSSILYLYFYEQEHI